jgi:hypothetical protein
MSSSYHSEWEVEKSTDNYYTYRSAVYQFSTCEALNERLSVFAILDFDFTLNILKVKYNVILLISYTGLQTLVDYSILL